MVKDEEIKNFKILIECAEKYIEVNAGKILIIKRIMKNKENLSEHNCKKLCENLKNINCFKLIEEYKPDTEKPWFDKFLIHLQNYQAMPKAINYDENKGKIKDAIEEYKNSTEKFILGNRETEENININKKAFDKLYSAFCKQGLFKEKDYSTTNNNKNKKQDKQEENKQKNDEQDKQTELKKLLGDDYKKYHFAWAKYTLGVLCAISFINSEKIKGVESLIEEINIKNDIAMEMNNRGKDSLYNKIVGTFSDVYGMGSALSFDILKEAGCTNLIKPDIHIKEILKEVSQKDKNYSDRTCVVKMLELIEKYNKDMQKPHTAYEIDKLLWLCCTGTFYNDDIICTNMSRKGLLDEFSKEVKKNSAA